MVMLSLTAISASCVFTLYSYLFACLSVNPLHYTVPVRSDPVALSFPFLILSLFFSPSPSLSIHFFFLALALEHSFLYFTFYIYTLFFHAPLTLFSTAAYDQTMRDLAFLFRLVTSYPVFLLDTDRTFYQPVVALYVCVVCLGTAIVPMNAFTFYPVALFYHISSFESVSLLASH